MIRLYQFATSPFCAKVRKILDYKGLSYEVTEVDYLERKELLVASGQLMVPALTLESGATIVDSDVIAAALEEQYPEPAIFPPGWRGVHLALARYFDNELEEAIFRATIPFQLQHYARQGRDREAFYRMVRDRGNGTGFCDQMIRDHQPNLAHVHRMIAPLEDAFAERAFLLGRIGYADFAFYGQLSCLSANGELALPHAYEGLRAFYGRMDRITAKLDANT